MPFIQLPVDLHITTCDFLSPLDIVALSQTCTSLRAVSHERSIWISALKRSCAQNQILTSTFKPDEMSLEELQHASTAPQRILSKIRKGSAMDGIEAPPSLQPRSMHRIRLDNRLEYRRVCLIPGGRFLFAYGSGCLILYDLELSVPVSQRCIPLRTEYPDDFAFMPCPSPNAEEIRVLMSRSLPLGPGVEINVFRYILEQEKDEVKVLSCTTTTRWDSSFGRRPYTIVGNLVIFCDDLGPRSILGVWDFIQDTFAGWWITQQRYLEVFVDGPYVALVTSEDLQYWKIPSMHPLLGNRIGDGLIQDHTSEFSVPLNRPIISTQGYPQGGPELSQICCSRLFDWYNTFENLSSFDFIKETQNHESFTTFRPLSYGDNPAATRQPPSQSVAMYMKRTSAFGGRPRRYPGLVISVSPYTLCNGCTVKTFMDRGKIYVTTSAQTLTNAVPWEGNPVVVLILVERYEASDPRIPLSRKHFNFDPTSGRLAYITNDRDQIVVVDYLLYPW